MKSYNKTTSLGYFGTKLANIRWGWSGISDDGSVVCLIIWRDHTHRKPMVEGELFYNGFDETHENTIELWGDQTGNNDRKGKIKHAIEKLDGLVRVAVAKAVDTTAHPRVIESIYPMQNRWFKIVEFNENTGQFSLNFSHSDEQDL